MNDMTRMPPATMDDPDPDPLGFLRLELEELGRVHDVSLDLIQRSHDLDGLLDRILDEYETRLRELPGEALGGRGGELSPQSAGKLRALLVFAAQAAALKEKALAAAELRARRDDENSLHRKPWKSIQF